MRALELIRRTGLLTEVIINNDNDNNNNDNDSNNNDNNYIEYTFM